MAGFGGGRRREIAAGAAPEAAGCVAIVGRIRVQAEERKVDAVQRICRGGVCEPVNLGGEHGKIGRDVSMNQDIDTVS